MWDVVSIMIIVVIFLESTLRPWYFIGSTFLVFVVTRYISLPFHALENLYFTLRKFFHLKNESSLVKERMK